MADKMPTFSIPAKNYGFFEKPMSKKEIQTTIKDLANGTGIYKETYKNLETMRNSDNSKFEALLSELENMRFRNPIDIAIYLTH